MKTFSKTILTLAFASIGCEVQAQTNEVSPLIINGKIWAKYNYDLTQGAGHKNGFDIYRAFLQSTYKFDAVWSSTLLLDAARTGTTPSSDFLANHVRNAYIQGSGLFGEKSSFRFGIQPTALIAQVDLSTKTRWLGKSLTDETGMLASQDGGVGLSAVMPVGKYGFMIRNGSEGLKKNGLTTDNALTADVFVTVLPFGGDLEKLGLTVYNSTSSMATVGATASTGLSSNVLGSAIHFEHAKLDAALELAWHRSNKLNSVGYGAIANYKVFDEIALYGRFFTGNDNFKNSFLKFKTLLSVGPNFVVLKDKVSTALLFENKTSLVDGSSSNNAIMWNWAANF